jgi:hypothetical protein
MAMAVRELAVSPEQARAFASWHGPVSVQPEILAVILISW